METIEVNDLYHASYLLMNGQTVEEVKNVPVGTGINCTIVFSGEQIQYLTEEYLTKKACANLFSFRQAYQQITNFIRQATRSAKKNGKGVQL